MEDKKCSVILGDSLVQLKSLADNSVDAIVTDPPYGLSFMNKKWDYDVPSVELWREALRVLKPGGHLLSFGGTRTYHRMVVNVEDAGFEIRDQIQWLYGSGFPKSHDVSKAIDKAAGAEREVVGEKKKLESYGPNKVYGSGPDHGGIQKITAPSTELAKQWQGWGSALKPANEPICVARKPLEKGLTLAENVAKWGTGALNIDGSRIWTVDKIASTANQNIRGHLIESGGNKRNRDTIYEQNPQGRWPANIILDETAAKMLDEQSGFSKSPKTYKRNADGINSNSYGKGMGELAGKESINFGDSGGASRFFYVSKASKRERGEGNVHPTVKPIKLMEYLCKLITPSQGVVLDPFMGSGSTGVACKNLGFEFIGIEMNKEYCEIAEKRISNK